MAVFSTTGVVLTGNVTANNGIFTTIVSAASHTGTIVSVTGNITAGNLIVSGSISDSAQLDIATTAGNANIVLTPNGTGNVNIVANASVSGNVIANSGIFTTIVNVASHTGTIVSITGNITAGGAVFGSGNISTTGNVQGGNFVGAVAATTVSASGNVTAGNVLTTVVTGTTMTISTSAGNANIVLTPNGTGNVTTGANISATGNVTGGNGVFTTIVSAASHTGGLVSVTGTVTGSQFNGSGAGLTAIPGANVSGTVPNATTAVVAGTVTTAAQANITSVGTLTTVTVSGTAAVGNLTTVGLVSATGTVTGSQFNGSGAGLTSIPGANVTGTLSIPTTSYAATVSGAAQANITSVGTLTSLAVTNAITGASLSVTGNVTANNHIATGVLLSTNTVSAAGNITGANLVASGVLISTNTISAAGTVTAGTYNGTTVSVTGTVTAGTMTCGGLVTGSGGVVGQTVAAQGYGLRAIAATTDANATIQFTNTAQNAQWATITSNAVNSLVLAATNVYAATDFTAAGAVKGASLSVTGTVTAGTMTCGGLVTGSGGVVGQTVAAQGYGMRVIAATTDANATIQFTNTAQNVQWATITSNVAGSLILDATTTRTTGSFIVPGTITVNSGAAATAIINGAGNAVGNIGSSGTYFNRLFAQATTALYADLAEMYTADAEYAPGTVLELGGSQEVTISLDDSSSCIAGVVSTNPAHLMNGGLQGIFVTAVALVGRVPCNIIGPIYKGNMIVSAGNGRGRAESNPKIGTVIGKAVENHPAGPGVIEILIGKM